MRALEVRSDLEECSVDGLLQLLQTLTVLLAGFTLKTHGSLVNGLLPSTGWLLLQLHVEDATKLELAILLELPHPRLALSHPPSPPLLSLALSPRPPRK